MKIICVCKHCRHREHEAVVEFNFADGKMYWVCPECKKENSVAISEEGQKPAALPKSTTLGRRRGR